METRSLNPITLLFEQSKDKERGDEFEMKDFNAKKDLVSSREPMSMKGIGTTVDAITIPVSCNLIYSNQKVTCFSPVRFKQQSREEEGGDKI